jgi:uncharacterized membrane protein (DUF373 family)
VKRVRAYVCKVMGPDQQGRGRRPQPRESAQAESLFAGAEAAIYVVVGAMLVGAALLILAGTVVNVIERAGEHSINNTTVFVLSRILLLFIVAELIHTLRLVNLDGRILVEPFLFIGLIAVVRRILIVTAEFESAQGRSEVTDFVIQIGALGGLALLLAIAIYLLRRSNAGSR